MPWFIQILLYLGVGTVVVIGAVLTMPYFITKWLSHDQATCDCWDCRNRRTRSLQRRADTEEENRRKTERNRQRRQGTNLPLPHYVPEKEERNPDDYWTTEQLRTGFHVLVKGVVYEVGQIRTAPDGNCLVFLRNILTKVDVRPVVITRNMMRTKLWRKGFGHDIWR